MSDTSNTCLPLTTAQRSLWIGYKLNPKSSIVLAEALQFRGLIEPKYILKAAEKISQEFDALRSCVIEKKGVPYQIILPEYRGKFPYYDLSNKANAQIRLNKIIQRQLDKAANLAHGPLWRCVLFRLDSNQFFWAQFGNHVVIDGYAGGLVARRLAELYNAYAQKQIAPPCHAGNLNDLLDMEKEYRSSPRFQRDRDYWKMQLANAPLATTLARRLIRIHDRRLLRSSGFLTPNQVKALHELGRQFHVSLPQVLITILAVYFYRMIGQEDLIFGMPVTGRINARCRQIPSMMANAVFIRLKIDGDAPFHSLFSQVGQVVKNSLRHQQYRYEDIRKDLGLVGQDQQLSGLAINVEAFDYHLDFNGVPGKPCNLSNGSAEDLTVFFYERGTDDALRFDIDANPSLYDKPEIDGHCWRIERLAAEVLRHPAQAICAIDLLQPHERQRLIYDWNATEAKLPKPSTVLDWFRRRVEAEPEAVAVTYASRSLNYGQLYECAGRLAAKWVKQGVLADDVVVVALPRSEQLLITFLAVMWVGACYLPLDPDDPCDRHLMVLKQARAACAVCPASLRETYVIGGMLWLDPSWANLDQFQPLSTILAYPEKTAYVLYTSGTTGQPKGVLISHQNLANFLFAMRELTQLSPQERVLALTVVTFDIAGLEFFLPLICGASVVIADRALAHDPQALGRFIQAEAVTVIQATPSLWRLLLLNKQVDLSHVHALVGGESLPADLAQALAAQTRRITHLYGPTETTIWSIGQDLHQADLLAPPIGRPLANTSVYLLDQHRHLLPIGVVGELYISGLGVAKGYLHQPEITAANFMPDPFHPQLTMYRTGDLARWREDGVLEFIGRVDHQLKIRGHRIEPAEIEAVLVQHPDIAEALVVGNQVEHAPQQLVAYVVSFHERPVATEELRRMVRERLPEYMVPSIIVPMRGLPLTANGKVDRSALPAPVPPTSPVYIAPRDDVEQELVTLWQSILGQSRIGIHDNFFEIGGDSFTATQFLAQIPERFGVDIPLGSLFHSATIAEFATLITQGSDFNRDPLNELLLLRQATHTDQPPLFCAHPVTGLGWSYLTLMSHLDPNLNVYALQSPGLRLTDSLPASIEDIAGQYVKKIQTVQPRGPYRLLGWSLGGYIAHEMAWQLRQQDQEVELLAILDAYPYRVTNRQLSETERIQAAMSYIGITLRAGQSVPTTMAELADFLCAYYQVHSLSWTKSILKEEPNFLNNVGNLMQHHLQLAAHYRPKPIDVDLHFFVATQHHVDRQHSFVNPQPDVWCEFVRSITSYPVNCDHQTILNSEFAPVIAKVIQQLLDATETTRKGLLTPQMDIESSSPEWIAHV